MTAGSSSGPSRDAPTEVTCIPGASHAALMLADAPAALAPLDRLPWDETSDKADPWQDYRLGAGRSAANLLASLWARGAQ